MDAAAQLKRLRQLITAYFPEAEWAHAECIARKDCLGPQSCVELVNVQGFCPSATDDRGTRPIEDGSILPYAFGPFLIVDTCYRPELNEQSPFTVEQWARVRDDNVNVWMASVIWARYGWAAWSNCPECFGVRSVTCHQSTSGGIIPHPEGPIDSLSLLPPSPGGVSGLGLPLLAAGLSAALLMLAARRRR